VAAQRPLKGVRMSVGEARENKAMETLCGRWWFGYPRADRLNLVLRKLE
jgi:hypothetical protein